MRLELFAVFRFRPFAFAAGARLGSFFAPVSRFRAES